MISLYCANTAHSAGQLVLAALSRSVSKMQIRWQAPALLGTCGPTIIVVINPTEEFGLKLLSLMEMRPCKLILFGELPPCLIQHFRFEVIDWPRDLHDASRSASAPSHGFAESRAKICYRRGAAQLKAEGWSRPFERFDFADEWNNLGYGRIRSDCSIWSVAQPLKAQSTHEIAGIEIRNLESVSYCALFDELKTSTLWINRPVGTIDSYEWRLVEYFIASYRADVLPCQPVILEIPGGYDAAITMRLDCDEDVESARPLWNAYREMNLPFSLAVHTSNLTDAKNHQILQEMTLAGESILSHTATHASNWGGTYEAAFHEGMESAQKLKEVTGQTIRFAVSPFHQAPSYALQGLVDAGYEGVVGGIIRNDPEFLISRGGELAGLPSGFIGHSQQCMLHGDCLLAGEDPLAVYKLGFDLAFETNTMFGYLDHPFSSRYQYGWQDEASRVNFHRAFIHYIQSKANKPIFLSQTDALGFIQDKMFWQVEIQSNGYELSHHSMQPMKLRPQVEYRGHYYLAEIGARLS